MTLRTILFDFDGTLVDTRKAAVRAFWETIEACGFLPPRHPIDLMVWKFCLAASRDIYAFGQSGPQLYRQWRQLEVQK